MTRLEELKRKYPRQALELDLVSGRISPETGLPNPDYEHDDIQDRMEEYVLEVIDVIDNQGHSGSTHGYFCSMLIPLLKDKPITPLTGNDWEWQRREVMGDELLQNRRCYSVFKEGNRAYNVHGKAFSDDGGDTYFTCRESNVDISFPCSCKDLETEYVIIDKEKENAED